MNFKLKQAILTATLFAGFVGLLLLVTLNMELVMTAMMYLIAFVLITVTSMFFYCVWREGVENEKNL